jgi:HEAT repeat protein
MRHLYDSDLMPFFLEQAGDKELHPQVRIEAVVAYALLANADETRALKSLIRREPASADGGERENFEKNNPALDAATACNEDLSCWIGKLADEDALIVRKASYMLGRYGRGHAEAVTALVDKLGHNDIAVRLAALTALDRIATDGSEAAVAKIDELQETEEGRKIWSDFSREALPIQARLRNRAAG